MSAEAIVELIGICVTFMVSFATFIWWASTKFWGLKSHIDLGFADVKKDLMAKHHDNVLKFQNLTQRIGNLEREKRLTGQQRLPK